VKKGLGIVFGSAPKPHNRNKKELDLIIKQPK